MLPHYRELFGKAIRQGRVQIECEDKAQATSIRQKLYRYRRLIRNSVDPFALLVDDLKFSIQDSTITITYADPDELKLLQESLNDNSQQQTAEDANS